MSNTSQTPELNQLCCTIFYENTHSCRRTDLECLVKGERHQEGKWRRGLDFFVITNVSNVQNTDPRYGSTVSNASFSPPGVCVYECV